MKTIDREDTGPWLTFSDADRLELYGRCKNDCFLVTSGTAAEKLKDPSAHLKFPICRPTTRTCAASASGILAARRRAILTKKYPDLVTKLTKIIESEHLTKTSRKNSPVTRIRILKAVTGKFPVRITYASGVSETLDPLSGRTILKRYGAILSDAQMKKLR